jgi:hypothetical protein
MILIAYKNPKADNPAASHAGLGVTASNEAETLIEHGHPATAMPVVDGYYLRDKLRLQTGVTNVVLCAPFFDTPFMEALCREFPRIQFACVFHSNCAFLGVDSWSTKVLREQGALSSQLQNFSVAGNSRKFCAAVRGALGNRCLLLPNLYYLHGPIQRIRALWKPGAVLRIGAFGATRPLKNLPTACWAAMIIRRATDSPVEFHVSAGREEGANLKSIEDLVRGIPDFTLVKQEWKPWLEFRMFIRSMHLLMQPSFTESFNGVTADGIAEGVPSVVGPAIDWVPGGWHANPDDAVDIAAVGRLLLRDKRAVGDGYRALADYNERSIGEWRQWIA